jgi:YD repeat-containing protein
LSTAFEYDGLGCQRLVTDPDHGTTALAYDNRDNLVSVTNARGIVIRRYEYDRKDRLTRETRPDETSYAYSYDDATGTITRTDAKGQRTRYLHDDAGRLATDAPGAHRGP